MDVPAVDVTIWLSHYHPKITKPIRLRLRSMKQTTGALASSAVAVYSLQEESCIQKFHGSIILGERYE
jgi:hypothetical protein